MNLTKGFVWAVLLLIACGPIEVDERHRKVVDSANVEAEKPETADPSKNDGKSDSDTTDEVIKIPESKLPWDGVELQSTRDWLILEME